MSRVSSKQDQRFRTTGTKVGSGTYGQVFLAERSNDSRQKLSVKQCKINKDDKTISSSIFRELVLLSEINYPHIVHISEKDIVFNPAEGILSFAYEYATVDLRKLVNYYAQKRVTSSVFKLKPVVAKSIIFQLLLALDYLHQRSIAHCDVTPSNILLMSPKTGDIPGCIKLIDFGLSRVIETHTAERNYGVVTVWYRAPELLLGDTEYDQKIDIWAAGCVFAELLTGQILFATKKKNFTERDPTEYNRDQVAQIVDIMGPITESDCPRKYKHMAHIYDPQLPRRPSSLAYRVKCDETAFDLLSKMLVYDPNKRISAAEAIRHKYFNENPICVMNIAAQIPPDEWCDLEELGKSTDC